MNRYPTDHISVPSVTTVLAVGAAWFTFIAVAAVASLGSAASMSDVTVRFMTALAMGLGAVYLLLTALRVERVGETEVSPSQPRSESRPTTARRAA